MCFVLYMASDKPRPTIPWNPELPGFHVRTDEPAAETARIQFTKAFIHYLGSHDGCGCGFRQYMPWEPEGPEDAPQVQDHALLCDYLKNCLADESSIELFGCWSGKESVPIVDVRTILVDDIVASNFGFRDEGDRLIVISHSSTA